MLAGAVAIAGARRAAVRVATRARARAAATGAWSCGTHTQNCPCHCRESHCVPFNIDLILGVVAIEADPIVTEFPFLFTLELLSPFFIAVVVGPNADSQ